jgi:hypothetical protein
LKIACRTNNGVTNHPNHKNQYDKPAFEITRPPTPTISFLAKPKFFIHWLRVDEKDFVRKIKKSPDFKLKSGPFETQKLKIIEDGNLQRSKRG